MKDYIKMVVFILVLGAVSALLLIGTDALTKNRIEENKKIELYSAILDSNEIEYSKSDVISVFNDNYDEPEKKDGLERYKNKTNGNYSFIFEGGAMWGPVKGVMTLKEDFQTIVAVKILEQEETPGLGAEIANPKFLIGFKDVAFNPIISIADVGTIAGATNTLGFFQRILNTEFEKFYRTFVGDDLFNTDGDIMEILLDVIGVELKDGENLVEVFNTHFETLEEDDLIVYLNKDTNQASFSFEPSLRFAQDGVTREEVLVVVTLDTDFETIVNISVKHDGNSGQWGKSQLLTKENLAKAVGVKLPAKSINNDDGQDIFDGTAGATLTKNDFEVALNEQYLLVFDAFDGKLEVKETVISLVMKKLLDNIGVKYEGNLESIFFANFKVDTKNGLDIYYNEANNHYAYYFVKEYSFGVGLKDTDEIPVILTFEDDFETIVKIDAIHDNDSSHFGKTTLFSEITLQKYVGLNIILDDLRPELEEGPTSPTTTRNELAAYLKEIHLLYIDAFNLSLEEQVKQILLKNIGIDAVVNIDTLFDENFTTETYLGSTLYKNKVNGNVSYFFNEVYSLGRGTPEEQDEEIPVIVTIKDDFKTIVKINAIHDNNGGQWGKVRLFTEEVLDRVIDKQLPLSKADFADTNLGLWDRPDGLTGATKTEAELVNNLNDYSLVYKNKFTLVGEDLEKVFIVYQNNIKLNDDVDSLITNNFTVEIKDGLTLYTNKANGNVSFVFTETYSLGRNTPEAQDEKVPVIVTLEDDFKTIVKISAIHDNNSSQWGKVRLFTEEVLDRVIGKKIPLSTADFADTDLGLWNRPDGLTGATKTETELVNYLNTNVTLFENTFKGVE